jgi:hypothetical protein
MGMGAFLAVRVRAFSGMLVNRNSFTEFSVRTNRKNSNISASIIGGQEVFPRRVHTQITGIFTFGRNPVHKPERHGCRIEYEELMPPASFSFTENTCRRSES